MNPWPLFWTGLGWVAVALLTLLAVLVVIGIWMSFWGWFQNKRANRRRSVPTTEDYALQASIEASRRYAGEIMPSSVELAKAFSAGAAWGWKNIKRK